MAINEKYSYKSFKRQTFLDVPTSDFEGEIVGACFAQDEPFTDVFPPDLKGTIFTRGNYGNCNIPSGNTMNAFNEHYKEQNDCNYWVVDKDLKPITPLHPDRYDEHNISKDPKDIPAEKLQEPRDVTIPKERQEKIDDLSNDKERLEQILIDNGEIDPKAI